MVVSQADIRDYSKREVLTLPVSEFRAKYGGIPIKNVLQWGPISTSIPDTAHTHQFKGLENAVVRYIPFSDTDGFADAAVVFDERNQPVMELGVVAVRGLDIFYVTSEPTGDKKRGGIARIYEHLQDNPLPATVNQGPGLYQRARSLFSQLATRIPKNR